MMNHVEVSEDDLTPQALLPNLVIQVVVSIMMDPALGMQVVVRIRLEVGRPIQEEIPSVDDSYKFTGEDLILKDFGDVQSLVYQGKQNAKAISFCGKSLKVWEPGFRC